MDLLNLINKMENLYLKYLPITQNSSGDYLCAGDSINYSFSFFKIHNNFIFPTIKNIYSHFKKQLRLSFQSIELVNFDLVINSENQFEKHDFNSSANGSLFFLFDIPMMWFDNESFQFTEIMIPKGCELRFYINDKLQAPLTAVLSFNFNLFSNNLIKLDTLGTYEPCLYYFEKGARINRALVQNSILGLIIEYPNVDLEFSSEVGRLSGFDKFGLTQDTDLVFN